MTSDYKAITEHNVRRLGSDTASRQTQICMYSDPSHFIYEILQNADDYEATEIFFKLFEDQLVIEHNGKPFEEENVRAITYFGKSTSREDLVKTGRFGIGFKSVFAFTATPIIISGDEHFEIYGLYRVREYPYPPGFPRLQTRIILPFNHESENPDYIEKENQLSREEAYSKISGRLTELNMTTLLFTRNIRKIHWEINGRSGSYLREDNPKGAAKRTSITDGRQSKEYLVFSKIPTWKNRKYKAVEIAFGVEVDGEKIRLSPVDDFLYVLFATKEETRLKFIINGPFRTMPSRETISEEDPFNQHLMKEICILLKNLLPQLKAEGLLTTEFLSILPNTTDNLRSFYVPLFDAALDAFREQELVPTDDGQFVSSSRVFRGPARVREVISKNELSFFVGEENLFWAKGVQQNSRADRFLESLNIPSWGWAELQKSLQEKFSYYIDDDDRRWLSEHSDKWLRKLYILLAEAIRKEECSAEILRKCCIIRVLREGEEACVRPTEAYFPKKGFKELPQIKPEILDGRNKKEKEKIRMSLDELGVSEIGEEEYINQLLRDFYPFHSTGKDFDAQLHLQHMRSFIKWWKNGGIVSEKIKYRNIFRINSRSEFHRPSDCFIDSPIKETGLRAIYSKDIPDIESKRILWSRYQELLSDGFFEFAAACGVECCLPIEAESCSDHPLWHEMDMSFGTALWRYDTGEDIDYNIPGLKELIKCKDHAINLLIWNTLSSADPEVFQAIYRPNKSHQRRIEKSSLIIELSKAKWIPDRNGDFHEPCSITKEDLHPDFKYDNRNGCWLDAIGFGEKAKKEKEENEELKEMLSRLCPDLADSLPGLFAQLRKVPDGERESTVSEIKKIIEEKLVAAQRKGKDRDRDEQHCQEAVPFHEALSCVFSASAKGISAERNGEDGIARNPARRRGKIARDIAADIENENDLEQRYSFSERRKWKGKNDRVRIALSEWYNGQCQICGKTFIQKNGNPYFEGLYLVSYKKAEWIDRVGNVLCLCPWHSAMFLYGTKESDEDIVQQILNLKIQSEGGPVKPSIRLKLCGNDVEISFSEKHLIDLQEMIKASQKENR